MTESTKTKTPTDFPDLIATLALMIETELQTAVAEDRIPFNVEKIENTEDDEQITYRFANIKRHPDKANDKYDVTSIVEIIKTKQPQPTYVERVILVVDQMMLGEFTHISGEDIFTLAEKAYSKTQK